MKFNKLAFAVTTLLVSGAAWSHGYLLEPPARALLCNKIKTTHDKNYPVEQMNSHCGAVEYEPQSLETDKGFPYHANGTPAGPVDGRIASANGVRGSEMEAQSETRWKKTPMSAGQHQFTWYFTTPHVTTSYQYFITKNDWNPNLALSRASFEATPFCTVTRGGERPGQTDSHTCNVPARDGYQVILAVWTVGDTSAAFYNTADVEFTGNNIGGGDEGEQEQQHQPVIHVKQDRIVVEKNAANAGYTLDATNSLHATKYSWEVISGFSGFQLQEKNGSPTYSKLEGPAMTTPRAWVAANHTGTGVYRLTASNDFGSVTKDITVVVEDNNTGNETPGNDHPGHETPESGSWVVGKSYAVNDVVTYQGKTYRCVNNHRAQTDWAPGVAFSLWAEVK